MTREDIKHDLQALSEYFMNEKGASPLCLQECLKMLEQEPCEDVISREEAIDALNQSVNILEATDRIKDLSPAIPQPKIGHWVVSVAIQGEIAGQIVKAFNCSECGAISVFRMIDGKIVNGNLCPNCRAKMQEVGE